MKILERKVRFFLEMLPVFSKYFLLRNASKVSWTGFATKRKFGVANCTNCHECSAYNCTMFSLIRS
jgi:hypothetical protein